MSVTHPLFSPKGSQPATTTGSHLPLATTLQVSAGQDTPNCCSLSPLVFGSPGFSEAGTHPVCSSSRVLLCPTRSQSGAHAGFAALSVVQVWRCSFVAECCGSGHCSVQIPSTEQLPQCLSSVFCLFAHTHAHPHSHSPCSPP